MSGNPVREGIEMGNRMTALNQFSLKNDLKTLFVFGGSQGSLSINRYISKIAQKENDYQILWQTGALHYDDLKRFNSEKVTVTPFINDMSQAYAVADLVLCRAGASTLSELTVCGLPGILIPLSSSTNDHQTHNAKALSTNNAAKMINESALIEIDLADFIEKLIHNDSQLITMSNNAKSMAKPHATEEIVDQILERIHT